MYSLIGAESRVAAVASWRQRGEPCPSTVPASLLVTGAGGGIGAAVVELLTAAGHPVAVADRDLAAARAVAEAVPAGRPPVLALDLDVTDLDSVRAGVADAARGLGGARRRRQQRRLAAAERARRDR